MNTLQIHNSLCSLPYFYGVFPYDLIPLYSIPKPAIIVLNLDRHYEPGSHWVVLYLPNDYGYIEYFDSYGIPPIHKRIVDFMSRNSNKNKVLINVQRLQSNDSSVCGEYCCIFALYRSHGINLKSFVKSFTNDYSNNDRLIRRLFQFHFDKSNINKVSIKTTPLTFNQCQSCLPLDFNIKGLYFKALFSFYILSFCVDILANYGSCYRF